MASSTHTPGQVAELVGIDVETLRYYEGLGLLPAPMRTPAGRRMYPDETVQRLRSIRAARSLGLRLSEILAILPARAGERPGHDQVLGALDGALNRTRAELRTLNARRRELASVMALVRSQRAGDDVSAEVREAWARLERASKTGMGSEPKRPRR